MAALTWFPIFLGFLGLLSFFKIICLLNLFSVSLDRCFLANSFGDLFVQFQGGLFSFNLCLWSVYHVMRILLLLLRILYVSINAILRFK